MMGYDQDIQRGAAALGGVYAQNECAAPTRLQRLLGSITEARLRIQSLREIAASRNTQLTGHSGYPPTEVSSVAAAKASEEGIVGALEANVNELHSAISELEMLTGHLSNAEVVA